MRLHEEYHKRKKYDFPILKFVDKGSVILHAKEGHKVDHEWLHVSIDYRVENNRAPYFSVWISTTNIVYGTADFSNFTNGGGKIILEEKWEWETYEDNIIKLVNQYSKNYKAIFNKEAIAISWHSFIASNQDWFVNNLPWKFVDILADSLSLEDKSSSIKFVESFIKEKSEKVFLYWKTAKGTLDTKNYSDWFVDIFQYHSGK